MNNQLSMFIDALQEFENLYPEDLVGAMRYAQTKIEMTDGYEHSIEWGEIFNPLHGSCMI